MKKTGATWFCLGFGCLLLVFFGLAAQAESEGDGAGGAERPALASVDALRLSLAGLSREELQEHLDGIGVKMLAEAEEIGGLRIELHEARNKARLEDGTIAVVRGEIEALRHKIEQMIDELPAIKEQLDAIGEKERALLELMQERRVVLSLLGRLPAEEEAR